MSIIVGENTKLVVSGLTGREGSFHGLRNRDYGTDLVAGVNPKKGGEDVDGVESWLYSDRDVTVDTLTSVLVAEGILTLDDLCSGDTRKQCARLGLR